MLDWRKEECRALLTTLTYFFVTICKLTRPMRALDEAQTVVQTTIRDRIFIAKKVKEPKIYETWVTAARAFEKHIIYMPFADQYAVINAKIVDAATKNP